MIARKEKGCSFLERVEQLPYTKETKQKLSFFVSKLKDIEGMELVVLFGSYSRMEQKAGSDIDILAVTETEVPRQIRGELCSLFEENQSDLIFYTKQQFEESDCRLVREIRKDGILLWKK